jgi:hypothetical protein
MSHITRIRTRLVDKDILGKALADLNYKVQEGDLKVSGFGTRGESVELKISLPGGGEIGFRRAPAGYEILADWWRIRGMQEKTFVDRLNQRYAYHATLGKLSEQGFNLVEQEDKSGRIRLTLRRMA